MVQAGRIEAWGEWAGTAACSCTTVCSRENERGQFVDRGAAATLVIKLGTPEVFSRAPRKPSKANVFFRAPPSVGGIGSRQW